MYCLLLSQMHTPRTALHWACKRNHASIVQLLISNGADVNMKTFEGKSAASLASSEQILSLLGSVLENTMERMELEAPSELLPIVPNYLRNPPFPYQDITEEDSASHYLSRPLIGTGVLEAETGSQHETTSRSCIGEDIDVVSRGSVASGFESSMHEHDSSRLFKIRVHESQETDFIEVEVAPPSYKALIEACAQELEVDLSRITKIRKLPDVLIRKDRDVQRMSSGQKLEVILAGTDMC